MTGQVQYVQSGALQIAKLVQEGLANATVHLYQQPLQLNPQVTLAQMLAIEADYDGYAAQTVDAWSPPYLDPNGGATISSGYLQFNFATEASPSVTNNIYGLFVVAEGGELIIVFSFPTPAPMFQEGDAVPVNVLLNYGQ